ncbi:DEAD/DEAH box helicase [Epibacterium sp. MM17-32]|uniref:helicase-related protein n=1 Tax=Epibacterium sp. MM17-32 TaxID=2917734 RepID=UPI001EF6BB44|nr:DEAD/DEAH box helicase [Epibacterium sp. MM17-32]MCG7628949.1 DEAD/DEAH box helicase [Epibacterium sp. MM17-32]
MEKQLRDYQVADLAFYMANPRCGNFSDPGTGKTAPTCVYLGWLWDEKRVRSVWAMPKSLRKKNLLELLEWTNLNPEDVVIVGGSPARRSRIMKMDAKVFIMGFDCFANNWPELVENHPDIDCLAGDEWHMGFKTDSSQRTQSLYAFMERTTYLVAMTGTIIDGRLDTAFPLIKLCSPQSYENHFAFMLAHAIENDYGQVVAWRNPDRIGKIFGKIAIRHTFEEAYGPEAKVIVHEFCEMTPKQREAYEEFEETALLELEDQFLDGTLPGVNLIRCRQIMEHPQTLGAPLDKIKSTGKEERLMVHLEDHKRTGKPLVIFSAMTDQHDRLVKICKDMGFRVGMIDGRVSGARRAKIDEDFQAGLLDIVIASAATAGVGFNWPHVDHVIFISLDYMDSNFVQAYRRAIRGKRDTPLLITLMEYENSVDQKIFQIVEKKSALANAVDETKERIRLRAPKKPKSAEKPAADLPPPTLSMSDLISRNQVN